MTKMERGHGGVQGHETGVRMSQDHLFLRPALSLLITMFLWWQTSHIWHGCQKPVRLIGSSSSFSHRTPHADRPARSVNPALEGRRCTKTQQPYKPPLGGALDLPKSASTGCSLWQTSASFTYYVLKSSKQFCDTVHTSLLKSYCKIGGRRGL